MKQRIVTTIQRYAVNPVSRRVAGLLPGSALLETTGRRSGRPRTTPVGGALVDGAFWIVAEYGTRAQYVRNIQANPRVRVRFARHWHAGTAHLLPSDDARARLKSLPPVNSFTVGLVGTDLLTIRIDLDA